MSKSTNPHLTVPTHGPTVLTTSNGRAALAGPRPGHEEEPLMSPGSVSLTKRHKTDRPGIYYRLKADGSRTYQVNAGGGRYIAARTEKQALTIQADLRLKRGRGQKVVV